MRDADKRPYPSFVKAYIHNGVFKSLQEEVVRNRPLFLSSPDIRENVRIPFPAERDSKLLKLSSSSG